MAESKDTSAQADTLSFGHSHLLADTLRGALPSNLFSTKQGDIFLKDQLLGRPTKADETRGIGIEVSHLHRFSNKRTILLNDVSFAVPPNKLVCIVGRSGTGKSTLIEALCGLRPAQQGRILYDGQDFYRNVALFNTQLGYVPQEDTVHRDLTVERALYYAAKLRLPASFSEKQVHQRVDEVMEDVEIAHRRKLLVGKLSGGQRKRISIAMELLAHPRLFFLDEPTSGLDPDLDRKMMALLRNLADRGHTIVMSTHATANIDMCDYVCFLAEGGRLAYFGPPSQARAYFDKTDFAEIYATLEPTNEDPYIPEVAETLFKVSSDYQQYVHGLFEHKAVDASKNAISPPTSKKKKLKRSNPWSQFLLLSTRSFELLANNLGYLLILLLQAPLVGLILLLLVKYEIGTSIFDRNNVTTCPTTSQILTTTGFIDTAGPYNPTISVSCDRVRAFLKHDPRGQVYAAHRGGIQQALQDFIAPASGTDAQKVLFIMAFAAVMFGSTNAIREIVKEGSIYQRERAVNLGILPYMFSKIAVLGVLCLLQSSVLVVMVAIVAPFRQGIFLPPYFELYTPLALAALAGMMLGLAISAAVPNNDTALSFIPIILVPQVIFSGIVFPLKDLLSQSVGALFAARWAMIALGSSAGLHSERLVRDRLFNTDYTYHGMLFSTYSRQDAILHLLLIWSALLLMIIVLGIALAAFLKKKDLRR
ncbi:MAG: ABC transporter ATP-binding protein/permease [Ktedonobacteraceae bacterium]